MKGEFTAFSEKIADQFLKWIQDSQPLDTPNDKQCNFIRQYDKNIAVVQGPPGTGKTVTLAFAVLSRAYSRLAEGHEFRGLVVAPSNRGANTALEKTDEILDYWYDHNGSVENSNAIDELRLVRAASRDVDIPPSRYSVADFVNYHTDKDEIRNLRRELTEGQQQLDYFSSESNQQPSGILVFSTASGGYKLIDKVYKDGETTGQRFDLIAIDEASMMPVPQLLVPGSTATAQAQILVSGDHRQMPPVQQHDWDYEDRRIVQEIAPYLSVMDFFRLFSYHDKFGMDEGVGPEEVEIPRYFDIPIDRLEVTYRCHKTVAQFLRLLIYEADNIDYRSDRIHELQVNQAISPGIQRIMDPRFPLVLVVHDEAQSQQSNPFEAAIVDSLVDVVADGQQIGVVTPHNAQRGYLRSLLHGRVEQDDVDTVERFQGGERDLIVVSATVSDPDYLRREAGFILSPQRLNVALSRMKRKLVVIVPRTLLEFVPGDSDDYEAARVWKQMFQIVQNHADVSPWTGDIREVTDNLPDTVPDESIEVHTVGHIGLDDDFQR